MSTQEQDPTAATQADLWEETKQAAMVYLQSVWPPERHICPICGDVEWGISETALVPRRSEPDIASGPDLTQMYPVVPINCQTCGYTFFINEKWVREGGPPPAVREFVEEIKRKRAEADKS